MYKRTVKYPRKQSSGGLASQPNCNPRKQPPHARLAMETLKLVRIVAVIGSALCDQVLVTPSPSDVRVGPRALSNERSKTGGTQLDLTLVELVTVANRSRVKPEEPEIAVVFEGVSEDVEFQLVERMRG